MNNSYTTCSLLKDTHYSLITHQNIFIFICFFIARRFTSRSGKYNTYSFKWWQNLPALLQISCEWSGNGSAEEYFQWCGLLHATGQFPGRSDAPHKVKNSILTPLELPVDRLKYMHYFFIEPTRAVLGFCGMRVSRLVICVLWIKDLFDPFTPPTIRYILL